jgi:hypothetical protein
MGFHLMMHLMQSIDPEYLNRELKVEPGNRLHERERQENILMRLVIVESPYAGSSPWRIVALVQRWRNRAYARRCLRDCLIGGEAPIASHLLYTQPGVLRDGVAIERALSIEAGLAWGARADATVVYMDRGMSKGMKLGIERAETSGRMVEYRWLNGWRFARPSP